MYAENLKALKSLDLTLTPFSTHVIISSLIRLLLIALSVVGDNIAEVPYTDIDYRVVTDGARHVLHNESPFLRHTYRYSPLLAYLMIPNIILHECFGKLFFSICEIVCSIFIKHIVYESLIESHLKSKKLNFKSEIQMKKETVTEIPDEYRKCSDIAAYMMLYNPIGMVISSRGSNDAVSNCLILATFYFIQKSNKDVRNCIYAGILHGLSIHFRIFPIIFSLAYYLNVSKNNRSLWRMILVPNGKQISLALATFVTLVTTTYIFYNLYGMEYLQEAYLYHFTRTDFRHNFSLYFLLQYLNKDHIFSVTESLIILLPRIIILLYLSLTIGRFRKTLALCVFALTFVFVTYNTVVTSQYFVWYLTLLPLCYPNFRHVTRSFVLRNCCLWLVAQGFWLLSAYLLEFKCWNTFDLIGFQSMVFFLVNVYVLKELISDYKCLGLI